MKEIRHSEEFQRIKNVLYDLLVATENLDAAIDDFESRFGGIHYVGGKIIHAPLAVEKKDET